MAKSLEQLQVELSKATDQARKPYDLLHGVSGTGGLERDYNIAIRDKDAEKIARLKPIFEKAQADYKAAQEKKNAINKEIKATQKALDTEKQSTAQNKSAQAVYNKAANNLAKAERNFAAYQGQDKYIAAYQAAQLAANDLTKAGGKPSLPAPLTVIPPLGTGGGTGTSTTSTGDMQALTDTQALEYITKPGNEEALKLAQQNLVKNFGYKGPTDGKYSLAFGKAFNNMAATRAALPAVYKGASLLDFLANPGIDTTTGTSTGTGANVPPITDYPLISSETDAKKAINTVFQANLNRDATAAEIKSLSPALQKAQLANPTSYKETTLNGKKARIQYSGLDPSQWILDQINKSPQLKGEIESAKVQALDLTKRLADKKIYDKLIDQSAGDPARIEAAKNSTAYGRGLKEFEALVASSALSKGLVNTPDELSNIAKELYDQGTASNSQVVADAIAKIAKYGVGEAGNYTGTAGTTFDDLQKTAAANGLDLNKTFGSNLNSWIAAVDKGESVDTFKKLIRDTAKIGMPEKVAKLLDQGVDLQTIYTPYKNLMASTLEINPATITMNDPTLRSAITSDAEVPLYQFERQLRKDNRWQYTNQAKSEVGDATQQILKDFGFMG